MDARSRYPRLWALLPYILFAVVLGFLVFTEFYGMDFGLHVDEPRILNSVTESVRTGVFLPRWYHYPSVSYGLAVTGALPEILREGGSILYEAGGGMEKAVEWTQSHAYKLRVRGIFMLATLLSLVWVFLLIRQREGNGWEALLGAVLLGSSWELMYHARWIAPDGIMMQFAVLAVLLMVTALRAQRHRHAFLYAAAVAAGLCCGSKYPGGMLLIPLVATVVLCRRQSDALKPPVERSAYWGVVILFVAVFFLSTPGAFVEPVRFVKSALHEITHYQQGHKGHSVSSPIQHARLLSGYLMLALFSKFWPIALLLMGFAGVGAYDILRRDRVYAVYVLAIPAIYVCYFLTQRVMFVRNSLIVFPFAALLAARGVFYIAGLMKKRWPRAVLAACIGGVIGINLWWLGFSSAGIHEKATLSHGERVLRYIREHPRTRFLLAEKMTNYTDVAEAETYDNVTRLPDEADRLILSTSDLGEARRIVANRYGLYRAVSGIHEVNFSYYPLQVRERKILVVSMETARRLGLVRDGDSENHRNSEDKSSL